MNARLLPVACSLAAPVILLGSPALAVSSGFLLHFTSAGYTGCAVGPADATFDCSQLVDVGASDLTQFAWIIAFGWESIPGWPAARGIAEARFGISYDPTVQVSDWTLCTGGLETPQDDPLLGSWPESQTGNGVSWAGGEYLQPSGFARVGFLVIEPGSSGLIRIEPDLGTAPLTAEISAAGVPPVAFAVPAEGRSIADSNGTFPDLVYAACRNDPIPVRRSTWGSIKALYGS